MLPYLLATSVSSKNLFYQLFTKCSDKENSKKIAVNVLLDIIEKKNSRWFFQIALEGLKIHSYKIYVVKNL